MKTENQSSFGVQEGSHSLNELLTTLSSMSEGPIDINLKMTIHPRTSAAPAESVQVTNPIVQQLLPVFWNNHEEAQAFLMAVDGAGPTSITTKVNQLIRETKISKAQCKGILWKILHDAKIYNCSKQNWNNMVNF